MRCPQCSFDNPPGTRFCGRCGRSLGAACPSCGTLNPEEFAFCGTCGVRLTPTPAAPAPPQPSLEERKVVTILFADVQGSTTLAERLDPEQMRGIMGRFFDAMRDIIGHFGGTVEKFIGDEVMAVFGLPTSHEDDPARTVRAALTMHERLAQLNTDLHLPPETPLRMRVGINTGEVVANPGAAEKGEFMVTGDAVNVAARLRSAAQPGSTVVGERTYRQTDWLAEYQSCPPLALKGKTLPVQAWELVGIRPEPARRTLRAPMVGRESEFTLLQGLLQRVIRERKPHLVTILGNPGVGKSRLFEELVASAPPSVIVRQGRSLPYGSTSMWAVGEIIRADCGILRSDALPVVTQKLQQRLETVLTQERAPGEVQQVLLQLSRVLALHVGDAPASPEDSRDELFWGLRRYFESVAGQAPLIMTFEDVHSGDPALLDFVEFLAQAATGVPLFILCLARPELLEVRTGWGGGKRNYTSLFLEPLTETDTQSLLQGLLHADAPLEALSTVVGVAEGNPFFVEEILRMLIDAGTLRRDNGRWEISGAVSRTVPDTVQGVIAARLDRLGGTEKSMLQEASILGKDFWTGALAHLSGSDDRALAPILDTLQTKDFLVERERSRLEGQREFTFRHMIIHDVAYGMLPKSKRSEKHLAFGGWLEQTLGDRVEEFAELLAYHWLQAARMAKEIGRPDLWARTAPKALQFALLAGRKTARVYANDQAVTHFQTARALAGELGADAERVAAIEGLADVHALQAQWEEASRLYQEALDYHLQKGDAVRQARVQSRIGSTFSGVFDFRKALPHIQSAIEALKTHEDEHELAGVYVQMARTQAALGNFREAEEFVRMGVDLAEQYGLLPQLAEGQYVLGFIKTLLGRPDAAAHYERCIEIAKRLGDPAWIILANQWNAYRQRWRGENAAAVEAYTSALELAQETNNRPRMAFCYIGLAQTHFQAGDWLTAGSTWRQYLAMGDEVPAWVEHAKGMMAFLQGNLSESLTWAQKFLAHAQRRKEVTSVTLAVDWCGHLLLRMRQFEEARRLLDETLERFIRIGVFWPAFLHPLAAEAAVALGDLDAAAAHCDQAEALLGLDIKWAQARLLKSKGLLLASRGSSDQAIGSMHDAANLYRMIGQPYELALTLEALAGVHQRRDTVEDREQARSHLQEALAIYRKLGAEFEVRRLQP